MSVVDVLRTKKEAAEQLGVSVRTIERKISEGGIKFVHIGSLIRIAHSELDRIKQEGL